MKKNGKLIVFEGVEKAGKSTQIELLKDNLEKAGINVVLTKEPRGERREELNYGNLAPERELDLYFEDRAEDFSDIIIPALERGDWVLIDRCSPSTISYQHYGRGLNLENIKKRDEAARQGKNFDLAILFDIDPKESMKRAERKTRFEKENWEFHERVRAGYLAQTEENPAVWLVLDAGLKPGEIAKMILEEIRKRFL